MSWRVRLACLIRIKRANSGIGLQLGQQPRNRRRPFLHGEHNLDELALGVLVVPFGSLLKTGGIYALRLQPAAASHAACAVVMQWFAAQVEKTL